MASSLEALVIEKLRKLGLPRAPYKIVGRKFSFRGSSNKGAIIVFGTVTGLVILPSQLDELGEVTLFTSLPFGLPGEMIELSRKAEDPAGSWRGRNGLTGFLEFI